METLGNDFGAKKGKMNIYANYVTIKQTKNLVGIDIN